MPKLTGCKIDYDTVDKETPALKNAKTGITRKALMGIMLCSNPTSGDWTALYVYPCYTVIYLEK